MFVLRCHRYMQVLLFFSVTSISTALPHRNVREVPPPKVGWQSSPQNRGTFDLLLSCVTTLSLCAWTAYHPNVPTGRSAWRRLGHRLIWMGIAVIMPELVLWCAWEQLRVAKQLMDQINRKIQKDSEGGKEGETQGKATCLVCDKRSAVAVSPNQEEEPATSAYEVENVGVGDDGQDSPPVVTASDSPSLSTCSIHEPSREQLRFQSDTPMEAWTLSHSFFALSGGYALPSPHSNLPPLTLTPAGILLLLRLNIIPPVSSSAISDKSKADSIAKALVCLQAGWFFVQIIARAAAKLPITTLEVHVLAHVLYAFAIYAVWFQKGYDVGEPIVIESREGRDMGALFALNGRDVTSSALFPHAKSIVKCACSSPLIDPSTITNSPKPLTRHATTIYWSKLLFEFDMKPRHRVSKKDTIKKFDPEAPQYLAQVERANRALQLLKSQNIHMYYSEEEVSVGEDTKRYVNAGKKFTVPVRSDLTVEGLDTLDITDSGEVFTHRQIRTYIVVSIIYGALHLLALSPTHFPTRIEYYLWLSSTISMLAAPFLVMLVLHDPLPQLSARIENSPSSNNAMRCLKWAANAVLSVPTVALWMMAVMSATCYLFARPYVLVESLAGLRAVDARVYKTVEWTEFFPHVG